MALAGLRGDDGPAAVLDEGSGEGEGALRREVEGQRLQVGIGGLLLRGGVAARVGAGAGHGLEKRRVLQIGRDVVDRRRDARCVFPRSEEHTSELQSLMRNSYAVF